MGESIIDAIEAAGKYFGIGLSDAERKRGKYGRLYDELNNLISRAEENLSAVSRQIRSYEGTHSVPKTKVPGVEFSASSERVNHQLNARWMTLKNKLADAKGARDQAKRAYDHYKHLADVENRKKG